jgi:hypothetical protein
MGFYVSHIDGDGRGPSTLLWKGVDWERISGDPSYGYGIHEDFLQHWASFSTNAAVTNSWLFNNQTAGSVAGGNLRYGTIVLDAGSLVAGQGPQLQSGVAWLPSAEGQIVCEGRFSVGAAWSTPGNMFFGLHTIKNNILVSGVPTGTDFVGFRNNNTLTISATSENASTPTVTTTGQAFTAGALAETPSLWRNLGFVVYGTRRIEFYVDGILRVTHTTDIPDNLMALSWALTGNATSQPTMACDWMRCAYISQASG